MTKTSQHATVRTRIVEIPSFLWCCSTATLPTDELIRIPIQVEIDVGIEEDRRVIFADNFESGDFDKWDQYNRNESILSLVPDPAADPRRGDNSMKVTATLGENTGGGTTQWFEPSDPVFIRYYVKFVPDCDRLPVANRADAVGQFGCVGKLRHLPLDKEQSKYGIF